MEDRRLRQLTTRVNVLFPSQLMLDEFTRLYGEPPRHAMLPNPVAELIDVSADERRLARKDLVGPFDGLVVGFLGGMDDRKGWRELADGIAAAPDTFLLFGGTGSEEFADDRIMGRYRSAGYVKELTPFLAACDVLAVPSRFDPYALVVTEAAARGVPSITTSMVGTQREVLKHGAGVSWDSKADSFPLVVRDVASRHADLAAGAKRLAEALSGVWVTERLLQYWAEALEFRAAVRR
jgi:UDP-glucose:(heptosyl)LPS alpha-1,3-glucosyltransferase